MNSLKQDPERRRYSAYSTALAALLEAFPWASEAYNVTIQALDHYSSVRGFVLKNSHHFADAVKKSAGDLRA